MQEEFEKFLKTKTAIVIGIIILILVGMGLLGLRQEFISIKLFYPNSILVKQVNDPCSANTISYVGRQIMKTQTPIQDTIRLLLRGDISASEKASGFNTEFPNQGFSLASANYENGDLTLYFNDANNFTTGGSCRVGILRAQIEKTAKQFVNVKRVIIKPDTIFQP